MINICKKTTGFSQFILFYIFMLFTRLKCLYLCYKTTIIESKNIQVLQTDKPSRLLRKGKELLLVEIPKVYTFFGNTVSVNIYITNDEELKIGDFGFQKCLNIPDRVIKADSKDNVDILNRLHKCKKSY